MDNVNNIIEELLDSCTSSQIRERLSSQSLSSAQKERAHTYWTECGHRLRERINDDDCLEAILIKVLPRYDGAGMVLFRGENLKRYTDKTVGFCWTSNVKMARMFARGLNSYLYGGVLLQYSFKPNEIIAGPSSHSDYLGENEFTVAPSLLIHSNILRLESFPPSS